MTYFKVYKISWVIIIIRCGPMLNIHIYILTQKQIVETHVGMKLYYDLYVYLKKMLL